MIGNHVYGNHRTRGSNPLLSAKTKSDRQALNCNMAFLSDFLFSEFVMKRIISLIIVIILFVLTSTSVFAAETVSFEMSDCTTDNNRLFTVGMTAKSDKPLSAASFEFEYDKSMVEFRSAKTDNNSKITVNETDNIIKAVYLNSNGQNIKNGEVIFYLTFKSIKSGTSYIDFSVYDCIDSDVKSVEVGNCTSAKITVNGKSSGSNSNSKNEKSSDDEETESKSKSSRDKNQETTSEASFDELGLLNPLLVSDKKYLIIGICIGVAVVLLIGTGFFIGSRTSKKKVQKDNNNESSDG